jgi:hypothetical protein
MNTWNKKKVAREVQGYGMQQLRQSAAVLVAGAVLAGLSVQRHRRFRHLL